MRVDPLASLRIWAVEIELGGRVVEIPPLPAADWFPILASGDLQGVFDLVPSGDLDDYLLGDDVDYDEIAQAIIDAIEEVTGRSLSAAVMLSVVASERWAEIGGGLARSGFRWDVMPIGAALDAVYLMIVERMKPEMISRFEAALAAPVPGSGRQRDRQKAVRDFETLAGPRPTGGVRATDVPSGSARPRTQLRRLPRPPAGQ